MSRTVGRAFLCAGLFRPWVEKVMGKKVEWGSNEIEMVFERHSNVTEMTIKKQLN